MTDQQMDEQMGLERESMRAILEDVRTGKIDTYDVPIPELRAGGILVRTAYSAISAGTERAKVEASNKSLVGKALARPDLAKQVLDFARTNGIRAAYERVQSRLDTLSAMGYSCAGTVIALGKGVGEFQIGDRVACGGAGYASHCEVNWIPVNLAAHVPSSVPLDAAALTTIGAIAVQGLRQAQVNFGETVAVVGAGLVGVLTIQLARAAGCRVVAIDLDPARVERSLSLGAHLALVSSDPRLSNTIESFSRYGVDAVIVTAATRSAEPLELAAKIMRDRGRIVVVGDVGMGVSRPNMYHKEITLAMSRSYGPGRYDPSYEERGVDYPIGFVRWTEKRNMQSFLDLLADGTINVGPLVGRRYSVNEGSRAYEELLSGKGYTAILDYGTHDPGPVSHPTDKATKIATGPAPKSLIVGCIGAGGFARSHIFPALRAASHTRLESIATSSGVTAESARRNFKFAQAQTPSGLLNNSEINTVFVVSRHESHAAYVTDALRKGKSVFVEKPLAVSREQLDQVKAAYQEATSLHERPFLMVGFNRRFAPLTQEVRNFFVGRTEPMVVHIRVNAGFLPSNHWTQQPEEGGRIVGEACHFIDWALYVVGSPIAAISAVSLPNRARYNRDNVSMTIIFTDGSIANVLYLANGDPALAKEYFEVFCQGSVARLEDFVSLDLIRSGKIQRRKSTRDKGHSQELRLTMEALLAGQDAPIPFSEIVDVSEAAFSVVEVLGQDPNRVSPFVGVPLAAG